MATRSRIIPSNRDAVERPSYRVGRRIESFFQYSLFERGEFLKTRTGVRCYGVGAFACGNGWSRVCVESDDSQWDYEE